MIKAFTIFLAAGSVLVIAGAMFKILHYAGSDGLLLAGIVCCAGSLMGIAFHSGKTKV